jgi:hypothetical protein
MYRGKLISKYINGIVPALFYSTLKLAEPGCKRK